MYTEKMAKLSCLRHMTLKPIIRRQLYTGFSGVFEKIKEGFLVAPVQGLNQSFCPISLVLGWRGIPLASVSSFFSSQLFIKSRMVYRSRVDTISY